MMRKSLFRKLAAGACGILLGLLTLFSGGVKAAAEEIPDAAVWEIDGAASVQDFQFVYNGNWLVSSYAVGLTFPAYPDALMPSTIDANGVVTPSILRLSIMDQTGSFSGMRVAVWSEPGGQDDLQWYHFSRVSDGIWRIAVNTVAHRTSGKLNFHIYGEPWGTLRHIYSGATLLTDSGGWPSFVNGNTNPQNPGTQPGNSTPAPSAADYSAVFDAGWYSEKYADLKAAFGTNEAALLDHFLTFGMKEGRQGNEAFSAKIYRDNYTDLQKAFGDDLKAYYQHYISFGKDEGRNGQSLLPGASPWKKDGGEDTSGSSDSQQNTDPDPQNPSDPGGNQEKTEPENPSDTPASPDVTPAAPDASSWIADGLDYGAVFDADYYLGNYPDLKAAFGTDTKAAFNHFLQFGMREGRAGNDTFLVRNYQARYPDLQTAFGSSLKLYYEHYIRFGKAEGRTGK